MLDQTTIDRIAQAVAARIIPHLQNGSNGSGSNGNGRVPSVAPKIAVRLMTIDQAATYLGRSTLALYHLKSRREIPFVKHGRNLRFDRNALDKWLEGDAV